MADAPDTLPADFDFAEPPKPQGESPGLVTQAAAAEAPPDTLPANFFDTKEAPDTLPADFNFEQPEAPIQDPSRLGIAARALIRKAAPVTAGAIGGAAAFTAGAVLGGPTIVGVPVIGGVAGVAGAGAAGGAVEKVQEDVVQALGLDKSTGTLGSAFNPAQQAADERASKLAAMAGDIGAAAIPFGGATQKIKGAERVASGLINAGLETGSELVQGQFDPSRIAESFATGLALPTPRKFLSPAVAAGEKVGNVVKNTGNAFLDTFKSNNPERAATQTAPSPPGGFYPGEAVKVDNTTPVGHDSPAGNLPILPKDTAFQKRYAKDGPQSAQEVKGAETSGMETGDGQTTDSTIMSALRNNDTGGIETSAAEPPATTPTGKVPNRFERGQAPQEAVAPQPVPPQEPTNIKPAPVGAQPSSPAAAEAERPKGPLQQVPLKGFGDVEVEPHVAQVLNDPGLRALLDGNLPVNRSQHVPYMAGADSISNMTHIDPRVPRIAVMPTEKGQPARFFQTTEPLVLHEQIEKYLMERGVSYPVAHWMFAEPLEDAYYRSKGIDPTVAEKWWDNLGTRIQNEPVVNTPKTLYTKPYPNGEVSMARHSSEAVPQPTPTELAQAQRILSGPSKPVAPTPPRMELTPAARAAVEANKPKPIEEPKNAEPPTQSLAEHHTQRNDAIEQAMQKLGFKPIGGKARETLKETLTPEQREAFEALPPEEQARQATQYLTAKQSQTGQPSTTSKTYVRTPAGRMETMPHISVQSRADQLRKDAANKATQSAVAKDSGEPWTVPTTAADMKDFRARLTALVSNAGDAFKEHINAGKPELQSNKDIIKYKSMHPLDVYQPKNMADWGPSLYVREAKKVLDNLNMRDRDERQNMIENFVADTALLQKGDRDSLEQVRDRVKAAADALYKSKQPINEAGQSAGAQAIANAEAPQSATRVDFPAVAGKGPYFDQMKSLTDYLKGLPDGRWDEVNKTFDLNTEFGEPGTNDYGPQNPGDLLSQIKDHVAGMDRGATAAVTSPKGESEVEQLLRQGQEARKGAATQEEPKEISTKEATDDADAWLKDNDPSMINDLKKDEQGGGILHDVIAEGFKRDPDLMKRILQRETPETDPHNTQGDWGEAMEDADALTGGKGSDPRFKWLTEKFEPIKNYFKSVYDTSEYWGMSAKLKDMMYKTDGELIRDKQDKRDFMKPIARMIKNKEITADEVAEIRKARAYDNIASLPPKLKNLWDQYGKPMEDIANINYQDLYNKRSARGEAERLPDPSKGGTFVARLTKKEAQESFLNKEKDNVFSGKNIQRTNPAVLPRVFFKAREIDSKGNPVQGSVPFTYKTADNGAIEINNGKWTEHPTAEPTNIPGNTFTSGGKTYQIEHANELEIEHHTQGETQYIDNPFFVVSNRAMEMYHLNKMDDMFQGIKNDLIKNKYIRTDPPSKWTPEEKEIYANKPTALPQFAKQGMADMYLPKPIKWVLDDYHAMGFGGDHPVMSKINELSRRLWSSLFAIQPFFHIMNEADSWAWGRGGAWFDPKAYGTLFKSGSQAIRQGFAQQGADLREFRELTGNNILGSTMTNNIMNKLADDFGMSFRVEPKKWDFLGKLTGKPTPEMATNLRDWSNRITWQGTELLGLQRFIENKMSGMTPADAAKEATTWIHNYQMPITLGPHNEYGRFAQQFISTPAVSAFPGYHAGLFHSLFDIAQRAVMNQKPGDREKALGQMLAGAMLAFVVYPAMNSFAQGITGNKNAEFGSRGLSRLVQLTGEGAAGQRQGMTGVLPNIWTPSIPIEMLQQLWNGKDWRGKEIISQQNYVKNPSLLPRAAVQGAGWAARTALPPVGLANTIAQNPTGPGLAQGFLESQVGMAERSPKAVKWDQNATKRAQQDLKSRQKNPADIFERGYNWAARQIHRGVIPSPNELPGGNTE